MKISASVLPVRGAKAPEIICGLVPIPLSVLMDGIVAMAFVGIRALHLVKAKTVVLHTHRVKAKTVPLPRVNATAIALMGSAVAVVIAGLPVHHPV